MQGGQNIGHICILFTGANFVILNYPSLLSFHTLNKVKILKALPLVLQKETCGFFYTTAEISQQAARCALNSPCVQSSKPKILNF